MMKNNGWASCCTGGDGGSNHQRSHSQGHGNGHVHGPGCNHGHTPDGHTPG